MYIYKTTNLINGKIYIGQKSSINNIGNYIGSGKILKKAIEKYGKNNFSLEIIEDNIDNLDELNQREIFWINFYNSTDREIGYNVSSGGGGVGGLTGIKNPFFGKSHTDETKKKISKIRKAKYSDKNHPRFGVHLSKNVKEKISSSKLGEKHPPHSQDTRDKISKSSQGCGGFGTSTYIGVSKFCKNRWRASIKFKQKTYYLGLFPSEIDAAESYNKKAIELYGSNAIINTLDKKNNI